MKAIIILIFLVNTLLVQNTKIKYKGDAFYIEAINEKSRKVESKIPRGKNVELTYDTFYKSWSIYYTFESGERVHHQLQYISDVEGTQLMVDQYGHEWYVYNDIKTNKALLNFEVSGKLTRPGYIMGYSFEGIKLVK